MITAIQKLTLLFALALCSIAANAQLIVNIDSDATHLAQSLVGHGVIVSNAVLTGPHGAAGTFIGTQCNVGIDTGIILTSGSVLNAAGPNNSSAASQANGAPGDQDLNMAVAINNSDGYDACILEFDIQAVSDSVSFKYVFASEEYLEWACAGFNDAFAFFISGDSLPGLINIARVPGTSIPVSVDNINNLGNTVCLHQTNPQYYIDNGDGYTSPYDLSPHYIQYDGLTTPLFARIGGLVPLHTYHLKLVIEDTGDDFLDSGVFLEGSSVNSNAFYFSPPHTTSATIPHAVERCVNGIFTFNYPYKLPTDKTVHFQIGGTAINGVDYQAIPDSAVMPAGQTSVNIIIQPLPSPNLTDSQSVVLYLLTSNGFVYDSVTLYILDSLHIQTSASTASICQGQTVNLSVTGAANYTWSPAQGLNDATSSNPVATPVSTTTFVCNAIVGACTATDSVTVHVNTLQVDEYHSNVSCANGGDGDIIITPHGAAPYQYTWSNGDTTQSLALIPSGSYVVTVHDAAGCTTALSFSITAPDSLVGSATSTPANTGVGNGTATATATGGTPPYNYHWSQGADSATATGLLGGTYRVTVTDVHGCSATAAVIVNNVTGIASVGAAATFRIYPEPVRSELIIEISQPVNGAHVAIKDALGQTLITRAIDSEKTKLDLSGYATGIYFAVLTSDDKTTVKRFLIQK